MNKKRIKKLIEILERVPKRQFNMAIWIKNDYISDNNKRSVSKAIKKGMIGCVVGWAAQSKSFNRQGFQRDLAGGFYYVKPSGVKYHGVSGLATFLDISTTEARDFVYDHNYPDGEIKPKHAIKKLKRLLKHGDRYE